jgi:nitrogen fixation/metabolism regulation signal transduction histidine kinase
MASETARGWPFALGLAARGLVAGALVWGSFRLAAGLHYYATALVLLGLAAIAVADLVRRAGVGERTLQAFAEGLAAGAIERPARRVAGFHDVGRAIDRAADRLDADRLGSQRRIDELEALLDTVSASLFVLRPDGRIELVNRAGHALVGEEADRMEHLKVIGPELAAQLGALMPGGRAVVRLTDGRAALAVAGAYGVPGGERRRLISIQTIAGELDAVENKAWRDLVRVLAHEMMNSLTPIVSLAESLDRILREEAGADRADLASAAQVIARRSGGLMSFVDRYRKLADLPPPQLAPVRLEPLARALERLFQPVLQAKGVACHISVEPPELTVMADPDLLEQAVLNLVKNAIEAAAEVPRPQIGLSFAADAEGSVVISVRDNGGGLPADAERLFLPFFTTKAGGSGIGLSLARQIALAHHGRLAAETRDGGAVFTLVLPRGSLTA